MYRNRARAAHVLQPSAPVAVQGQLPPTADAGMTPPEQYPGYPSQPAGFNGMGGGEVSFFNPQTVQNGHMEPPLLQDIPSKGLVAPAPVPTAGGEQEVSWMNPGSLNNNINPGENYEAQYYGDKVEEKVGAEEFSPELTLDPSGQWYWDYNQQQWFPYYPADQNSQINPADQNSQISPADQNSQIPAHGLNSEMNPAQGQVQGQENALEEMTNSVQNLQLDQQDYSSLDTGTTPSFQPEYVEDMRRERQESMMSNGSYIPESCLERQPSVEAENINFQFNHTSDLSLVHHQQPIPEQNYHQSPEKNISGRNPSPQHVGAENPDPGAALGPPDLVDHRPNTTQPEIVSDISRPVLASGGNPGASSVPPPDMFASLPGSSGAQSPLYPFQGGEQNQGNFNPDLGASLGHPSRHTPDLGAYPPLGARPVIDLGAEPPGPPMLSQGAGASLGAIPKPRPDIGVDPAAGSQFAPDLTSQSVIQESGPRSAAGTNSQTSGSVSHDQHYDFYKGQFESAMPDITGGRSGVPPPLRPIPTQDTQGKAPDILRTEPLVPTSDRNLFMETGELREEDAVRVNYQVPGTLPPPPMLQVQQSMNKPPSDLPPMVGGNDPPSLVRMVVGESLSNNSPPPSSGQRMVEGESTHQANILQPLPTREVEGEALQDPRNFANPRTIEGEALQDPRNFANPRTIEGEDGSAISQLPPPVRSWEIDGQVMNPSMSRGFAALPNSGDSLTEIGYRSSAPTSPMESSPTHITSHTEPRSEAAGSERRDQTVMGGPPTTKVPPLPTPGRAVAGQESSTPYGTRRRGDNHKKSTYDSDDDRNQDSESERDREKRYVQPRRNVSPGARSNRSKPTRGLDRFNRSSTEREEDSDRRRKDQYRDRRDEDRGYKKDYGRYERGRYKDYRRGREDEEEVFREDDRRSVHGGGRRVKDETYRYRDDQYYRRTRNESDFERESFYGEDILNRSSRPSSRAGSVSHYDPNESVYGRGMQGNMAYFQHQMMQQQLAMMNPLQYQIQTAVREMDKIMENPENVEIYKQHWETYEKQPQLMEKLRLENPVMHHLLIHFRQNFWHLVETKVGLVKKEVVEEEEGKDEDEEIDQFSRQFHQLSPSHRPESRHAGQESTIHGTEESIWRESSSVLPERLTPLMFSRPHVCARISASGVLIKVEPAAPQEGQTATVELHSISAILSHTKEYRQLSAFPGPLNPRETHKNDVIKFCERKIHEGRERRMLDHESYELLWNMLILLLRQKGQVEGSDLADLLLREKRMDSGEDIHNRSRASSHRGNLDNSSVHRGHPEHREESSASSLHSEDQGDRGTFSKSIVNPGASQDESVSRFRSYLLHGNKQEGLEFAMKAGLWGHALFLASKMDQRTYAGVMTRFANGLAVNDPLQTLYQLMSARMPSSMKYCADQRWGDWRPHLAMILSNPLPGSDINRRSMVTLGDTLASKGQLYAAQFCYIVAAVEFGTFSKKSSKLVLLCAAVGDKSVEDFASNEAIQCTEIYEFVQKLGNHEYEMPTLQPFKFLHAVRLCEYGFSSRAQDYCRELSEYVMRNPTRVQTDFLPDFLAQLSHLSDCLKYQDPQYTTSSGELSEIPDPEWMIRFRDVMQNLTYGAPVDTTEHESLSYGAGGEQNGYYDQQYQYYQEGYEYKEQETNQGEYNAVQEEPGPGEVQEAAPEPQVVEQEQEQVQSYPTLFNPGEYVSQNSVEPEPAQSPLPPPEENVGRKSSIPETRGFPPTVPALQTRQPSITDHQDFGYNAHIQPKPPAAPATVPSLAPVTQPKTPEMNTKPGADMKQSNGKPKSSAQSKKSSWFGGIFGKILKAPNQVHLPDDSDKTIVYDEKLGRWVNQDGEEDSLAPAAPPPMDPSFMSPPTSPGPGNPGMGVGAMPMGSPPVSFRAPKRRGRGYVDVFGQSGVTKPVTAPPMLLPTDSGPTSLPVSPAIFNPSLGPTSEEGSEERTSLPILEQSSQEVGGNPPPPMMMFNPSSMTSVTDPPAF
jgi:hypothetical protein